MKTIKERFDEALKKNTIKKDVDKLKDAGFTGYVSYIDGEWELYRSVGAKTNMIALGQENVDKKIKDLKSEFEISEAKKPSVKKGDIITIGDLVEKLGIKEGNLDTTAIWDEEQTSIDNFDGDKGYNVYFEFVDKPKEYESDEFMDLAIKITDVEKL